MKQFYQRIMAAAITMSLLAGHSAMADNWMTSIPDETYVSKLSIPGTHDSATGEGFSGGLAFLGKSMAQTQDLTIARQWDCGIRAFDLRPTVKEGDDGYMLQIYHGIIETSMSFMGALQTLRDKLRENPGETAIVIMRHESNANGKIQDKWDSLMVAALGSKELDGWLVDFKPRLTLGEARGKILVMSRDQYAKTPVAGGYITAWSHSDNFADQRKTRFTGRGNRSETALVQDFYDLTAADGADRKRATVLNMLEKSMTTLATCWTVNHTSGYTRSASSNSNRENAQNTNQAVLDYLADEAHAGTTGIVMMDFGGVDQSGEYQTHGLELTRAVIAQNARYLGGTTGVQDVRPDADARTEAYTLDGRRTDGPLPKGLYVVRKAGRARVVVGGSLSPATHFPEGK